MSSQVFEKSQRVLRKEAYKEILNKGIRAKTKNFILFLYPNQKQCNRLGLIITRKVANSVGRNRIKRLIREYFRTSYQEQTKHLQFHDVVFIAKRGIEDIRVEDIRREVSHLYEKNSDNNDWPLSENHLSDVA